MIDDVKWYDEKNQEGKRTIINNRGLMPSCPNCLKPYKIYEEGGKYISKHVDNHCPYKQEFIGDTNLEALNKTRDGLQ